MIDFLQEHSINCAVLKERKWNEDRELRRAAKKGTRNLGFHLRVVQVAQLLHQGRSHFAGPAFAPDAHVLVSDPVAFGRDDCMYAVHRGHKARKLSVVLSFPFLVSRLIVYSSTLSLLRCFRRTTSGTHA